MKILGDCSLNVKCEDLTLLFSKKQRIFLTLLDKMKADMRLLLNKSERLLKQLSFYILTNQMANKKMDFLDLWNVI